MTKHTPMKRDRCNHLPEVLIIEDIQIPIVLERGKRKTLTIQITNEMQLFVKAPMGVAEADILKFIQKKTYWIYKQVKRVEKEKSFVVTRSERELRELKEHARIILTAKSQKYASILGVAYSKIRIGNQKTRWGSCSSKGTISYNWHLILLPEDIMDYVVVHELCHLIEMNHSSAFWELVGNVIPDYKTRREWLRKKGNDYE